jgi:hypothetical protein
MNANLEFSKKEYDLIINRDFILTKNRILKKIDALYGALAEEYKILLNEYSACLPHEIFTITPKIYRGEQYKDLPYVMLDYPRYFSKTNVFAIRSFFWWGNYFSITLQLSGEYLEKYADEIFDFINDNKDEDWYFGVHKSEWEHHFEKDNYTHFNELHKEDIVNLKRKNFIKIAKKLSLEDWKGADKFFIEEYKILLQIICKD